MPENINIRSVDGTNQEIFDRWDAKTTKETIGVYLVMDGNNKEQIAKLQKRR